MRFRLIPRDEGFYPLFEQQAANAVDAAEQLEQLMTSLPVVAERVQTIIAAERAGDEVMRSVRSRLNTVIVTPFDREDIQSLANSLDDVLDEMRAAADSALQHHLAAELAGVTEQVRLLRRIAEANVALVGRLRTFDDIAVHLDEIYRLETEADSLFRRIMAGLFDGNHEALEILKWKDVVEALERAINAVEEASVVIESIAVKHA
jgi:predicted phosphate transport protein (TIGR00153 family)